jgi:CxxC-x17-CxxC domain-containing protein
VKIEKRYFMHTDKTLTCKECGKEFTWTASEQDFYAEKGFTNEPQRCKECRMARKSTSRESDGNRKMFEAVCSSCGKTCKVPFEPHTDRPVFCSDCFKKNK